jgi:O-antigen/teichoic acid export membrane protein
MPIEMQSLDPIYKKNEWASAIPSLAFFAVGYQLFSRTPLLMLGFLGTESDVGLYSASTRAAEFIEFVYGAMTIAGASLFSSIHAGGDKNKLNSFTGHVVTLIFLITLPIYITLMVIAPWFLGLFGAEFVAGAFIMRLLLTSFFIGSIGGFVESKLTIMGYQRDIAIVVGFFAVLNIFLSYILIKKYDITGAAFATGASIILLKATLVGVFYKRSGIIALPFMYKLCAPK